MTSSPPVETKLMTLPRAVSIAARLVPRRATIPAAGYLLLEPAAEGIKVTSTNLDARIEVLASGELAAPVLVPGGLLGRILRDVPDATITATPRSKQVVVSGGGYSFDLYGYDPADFPPGPALSDAEPLRIPFDAEAFSWCTTDAARDDSRPVLKGVALHYLDGAMAASDGFRIKVKGDVWGPWQGNKEPDPEASAPNTVVIPSNVARYLPHGCSLVEAWPGRVRFRGAYDLTCQVIQGSFPRFETLIPQAEEWSATVNTAEFRKALDLVIEIARDGSGIVRLQRDGDQLLISARAEVYANAKVHLDASLTGEPRIALNGLYIRDAMAGAGETLRIGGTTPSAQVTFDSVEGRREIVMPMFVQWDDDAKDAKPAPRIQGKKLPRRKS